MIEKEIILNEFQKKIENCPVRYAMDKIGGKWKLIILHRINLGLNRFGIMQRAVPGISKQMLTTQLRELELDGLITRQIYAEIPPRVEYFMTEKGKTLIPILIQVEAWGRIEMKEKSPIPLK